MTGTPMDERTADELAALADGTLAPDRREALLARPDMAAQREALTAVRATASARAPERLHAAVAALAPERPTRRALWRRPQFSLSLAGATAAVIAVLVLALGGEQPSVAEAARAALAPATAPAPAARGDVLAASVDGVAYPYYGDAADWQAAGVRHDTIGGRRVETVVYRNAHGQRIGYAIAAGPALDVSGGRIVDGKRVLHDGGTTIVTWLRNGHTCVLAARGVDARVMLRLANWTP